MKKKAYAKINLSLNVTNKNKPNGLHDLDMINVCITLKDDISIKFIKDNNSKINITSNNKDMPCDENNLVYKVVEKFNKTFNKTESVSIFINKKIPINAGLAGGSSNASCLLNALDEHYKTRLTPSQKISFIKDITSDGPYMLFQTPCRIKGAGQIISPIKTSFKGKILIIKPFKGCVTKDVFASLDYKNLTHPNANKLQQALEENDYELLSKHIGNSLTESAKKINDQIEDVLNRLTVCGFEIVGMSGSGSTCFAMSKNSICFKRAKEILNPKKYDFIGIYKIKN